MIASWGATVAKYTAVSAATAARNTVLLLAADISPPITMGTASRGVRPAIKIGIGRVIDAYRVNNTPMIPTTSSHPATAEIQRTGRRGI